MRFRIFGLIISAFVVSLSFTPAAFASTEGDTCEDPEEPTAKGNNGWGNGLDSTNPGSDEGKTAVSKNPGTGGALPGPAKFTER